MKKQSETTTVLLKARDILANGWCQGQYRDGDRHCVLGALMVAAGYSFEQPSGDYNLGLLSQAQRKVEQAVGLDDGNEFSIPDWQDHPTTTRAGILDAVDRAIALSMKP